MSELPHGSGVAGSEAAGVLNSTMAQPSPADPSPYVPYRPRDFTPPASPRYNIFPALSVNTSRSPILPAYERETYSPSPASSPTLGPSLPSPSRLDFFRQRHGPLPSPLNQGFPRAEQPASPTMRQFSGPHDPRSIYNPLASNPVNPGKTWRDSKDELGLGIEVGALNRPRGQTTSSSNAAGYHPTLRSATSIPDYAPIRAQNRINPSGTYRPDRGGANWAHNDSYPLSMRAWPVPGTDEPRSSYRSGWTNASSGVLDTSGTERSSVFTKRSSTSDRRASIESKTQLDRELSHESHSEEVRSLSLADSGCGDYEDDDDDNDDVLDAIAMYEYEDEDVETNEMVSDEGYVSQTTTTTSPDCSEVQSQRSNSAVEQDFIHDQDRRSAALGQDESTVQVSQPSTPERNSEHDAPLATSKKHIARLTRVMQDLAGHEAKASISSIESILRPLPEKTIAARPRRNSSSIVERKSTLFLSAPGPLSKSNTFDVNPAKKAVKSQTHQSANPAQSRPAAVPTPTASQPQKPLNDVPRDRYGFKKETKDISVAQYDEWNSKYEEHVARRTKKWEALMRKHSLPIDNPVQFPPRSERVKRYIRKGIPPDWRGAAWFFYSNGPKLMAGEMKNVYWNLVAQCRSGKLSENDRDLIDRDLHRTFPDNIAFKPDPNSTYQYLTSDMALNTEEETPIIHALRRVLQAFALNNPNIGYCQSLNFIAGLLLLFLNQDEEKAFIMLTIITQEHLPGTHAKNLLNVDIGVLMMLIREQLPAVWTSIDDIQALNSGPGSNAHPHSNASRLPTVSLATTSWFMSLFIGNLPVETVLRVWDQFLYEGSRVLFRVALAIFKLGEAEIKECRGPDMMEVFQVVQTLPRTCLDPNVLVDKVYSGRTLFNSLSQVNIEERRTWWRELLTNDRIGKGTTEQEDGSAAAALEPGKPSLRRKTSKRFKQSFKLGR